jgi:lysophospholipase L1-like esterase
MEGLMRFCHSAVKKIVKTSLRLGLAGWMLLFVAVLGFSLNELGDPVRFQIGGQDYQVAVRPVSGGCAIVLQGAGGERVLSLGGGGEDLFPVVTTSGDHFFIFWIHVQPDRRDYVLYDSRAGAARMLDFAGFTFLSKPGLILQSGEPWGIVFLGNRSDNDDVFFFDLWDGRLVNLSRTPVSEKKFSVELDGETIRVSALTLQERVEYRMNRATLDVTVRDRRLLKSGAGAADGSGRPAAASDPRILANTFVAFGDSITWGKMRMNDLEGEYHPELAYPEQMRSLLASSYGPAYPVNLGIPGNTTFDGTDRIDADLAANPGIYFLLMLGTNDVIFNWFSVDSSLENIEYMISAAEAKGMRVIISTIPPRKDSLGGLLFVQNNIAGLNAGIRDLAARRKIGFVDTHTAFMNANPPEGWKSLLEDVVGNHPSPAGQVVIAKLFAFSLEAFPPALPAGVTALPAPRPGQEPFYWQPCYESDFSFFRLEYGFSLNKMIFSATTPRTYYLFTILPYQVGVRLPGRLTIYFRIQSVDKAGNASASVRFKTPE